jgi:PAS domain S-box-containing protein
MGDSVGARGRTGGLEQPDQLRVSDELLLAFHGAAPNAILIVEEDGRIAYANSRAANLFGYELGALVGTSVDRLVPDAVRPIHAAHRARYFAHPETLPMGSGRDLAGRRSDGTTFPVEIGLTSFDVGGRRLTGAIVADISARKAGELALGERERRFRTVLEASPNAILGVGGDGRIFFANRMVQTTFGYAPGDVIGEIIELLLPERVREDHVRHRAAFMASPTARPMGIGLDLAGRRLDGTDFPVEISLSPVPSADGLLVFATVVDISARKALEEELLQAQKMESVGRLAGGVAHDFNNMLTAISGYSELMLEDLPASSPLRHSVEAIHGAGARAALLTQQLLAFSRRQVLEPKVIDLNVAVRAIEPMLKPLIGERVTLVTRLSPDVAFVRADPGQLDQIIVNLAVNARDAMPDGGVITVETANAHFDEAYAVEHFDVQPGSYAMLSVTDTGGGMDRETRQHIFEPFFTTKAQGKGTGLGLATIYGVVRQSGGHIWLYSEPGHGTTFKIYFPQTEAELDSTAPGRAAGPGGTGTILLVEDEDAVREFIQEVLERRGYRVLTAPNASAALAIVDRHDGDIDALLTDVVMPGQTGPELAALLRRDLPGLAVLFVSGYSQETLESSAISGAATAYVSKPFSPDVLATQLDEVIREAAALRATHPNDQPH